MSAAKENLALLYLRWQQSRTVASMNVQARLAQISAGIYANPESSLRESQQEYLDIMVGKVNGSELGSGRSSLTKDDELIQAFHEMQRASGAPDASGTIDSADGQAK